MSDQQLHFHFPMMTASKKLSVLPDADRVEVALAEVADAEGLADGRAFCTLAQLLQLIDGLAGEGLRPASPLLCRMVLSRCARRLPEGPYGVFAREPAFARAALSFISELKSGGLSPAAFGRAAEKLEPARRPHGKYLAQLYAAYEEAMAQLQLADKEDELVSAMRVLERGFPPSLGPCAAVEVSGFYDFTPLRAAFFEQLASACERAQVSFSLEVPGAGSPTVDACVDPLLSRFEKSFADARCIDMRKTDFQLEDRPLAPLGSQLFSSVARAPKAAAEWAPHARLWSASSPVEEMKEVARRVSALAAEGVPPDEMAIVYRDLAGEAEGLSEELASLGIPSFARRGIPLLATALGRLALELPLCIDEGFTARRVSALLGSRHVPSLSVRNGVDVDGLFDAALIRDNRLGATATEGAYRVRLGKLQARLSARGAGASARDAQTLLAKCEALFSICESMRAEDTFEGLWRGWRASLEALGIGAEGDGLDGEAEPSPLGRACRKALGRDGAAREALALLSSEVASALELSKLGAERVERRSFAHWLADWAADFNLPSDGPKAGAVPVLDMRELVGRSFSHVFIAGVSDGRLPGREAPSLLLGDADRRALNVAAGRPVFRLFSGEGEGAALFRLAEDRLLFYVALASAKEAAWISYARADDAGREQLASPFIGEVERILGVKLQPRPFRPLPLLEEVQTEGQLQKRAALEGLAAPQWRSSEPDRLAPALRLRLLQEDWFAYAKEMSQMEEERLRYFSNSGKQEGRYSGYAGEAAAGLFAFGPENPLSASSAGRFGNCGFQGFLVSGLGLREPEEMGEEQDARGRGSFWHRALELLFPRLAAQDLLGVPLEALPPGVLEAAVAEAAAEVEAQSHVGHPSLWELSQQKALKMARRLLSSEERGLPFSGLVPSLTEHAFGPEALAEEWKNISVPLSDGTFIFLEGKIDRLDASESALGVVDYKSSLDSPGKLWESVLTSQFQLPFYLYAVSSARPGLPAQAAWLKMKEGSALLFHLLAEQNGHTVEDLLSVDLERRRALSADGKKNLANALEELVLALRRGQFSIRPKDCRFCSFARVCRISERSLEDDA